MDFVLNEFHRNVSDNELLDDMKHVATLLNQEAISRADYKKHGKFGYNTYLRRFGGWNEAQRMCGLSPNAMQLAAAQSCPQYRNISDEDLLNDIRNVAALLDKETISSGEYKAYCKYSKDTCLKRFSTWDNALALAGLKPFTQKSGQRIKDDDLLEEIERLWIALGRQPTTTDIRDGMSKYTLNTYARHFGGWRSALETFICWINTEKTEAILPECDKHEKDASHKRSQLEQNKMPSPKAIHKTTRDINLRVRFKVMLRDNFKCCFCGASPAKAPGIELQIDHIAPWSKGGETTIDNLQTLCSQCNLGKSNMDI